MPETGEKVIDFKFLTKRCLSCASTKKTICNFDFLMPHLIKILLRIQGRRMLEKIE
jgi:hypothetical protein